MLDRSFVELWFDHVRVGFPLEDVERVLRAAAVTPVPGAAGCLLGMLDLHGEAVPVYDTRRLLGLPHRDLQPEHRFVLTRGAGRRAVFVADAVAPAVDCGDLAEPDSYSARSARLRGVTATRDGMLLVHDLKRFLYLERALTAGRDA